MPIRGPPSNPAFRNAEQTVAVADGLSDNPTVTSQSRGDGFPVTSTGGVTVRAHDMGGEGDALLICHATGLCGRAYAPLAAELARGFHVWAVDVRGHGDSDAPADGDFSWSRFAEDVVAVADAIACGPVVAFGHSMGGAVVVLAELLRPGLLTGAYLFEPGILPGRSLPPGAHEFAEMAARRREVFPSRGDVLARFAVRDPYRTLRADALAAYAEHGFEDQPDGSVRLKCLPAHEALTFEGTKVSLADVGGLDLSLTVAYGGRGAHPSAEAAPTIAAGFPRARLVRFDHLSHFGPLQDPESVAEDILAAQDPNRNACPPRHMPAASS